MLHFSSLHGDVDIFKSLHSRTCFMDTQTSYLCWWTAKLQLMFCIFPDSFEPDTPSQLTDLIWGSKSLQEHLEVLLPPTKALKMTHDLIFTDTDKRFNSPCWWGFLIKCSDADSPCEEKLRYVRKEMMTSRGRKHNPDLSVVDVSKAALFTVSSTVRRPENVTSCAAVFPLWMMHTDVRVLLHNPDFYFDLYTFCDVFGDCNVSVKSPN